MAPPAIYQMVWDTTNKKWTTIIDGAAAVDLEQAVLLSDGLEGTPSLRFFNDPDTGLWRPGTNRLQLCTAGAGRWEVDATGQFIPVDNNTYGVGSATAYASSMWGVSFKGIGLAAFGFSSGQGNNAGGADTVLSNYDVTIPSGLLRQPGDALVLSGTFYDGAGGLNNQVAKLQIDATGLKTLITNPTALVNHILPFVHVLRYRTNTTGSLTGHVFYGCSAASPNGGDTWLTNASFSGLDWTASQVLHIYTAHATANALRMSDYNVFFFPCISGSAV